MAQGRRILAFFPLFFVTLLVVPFQTALRAAEDGTTSSWCTSVAFAPPAYGKPGLAMALNGDLLFRSGGVRIYDGADFASFREMPNPHTSAVWKVLFSPQGNRLASSDYQGEIRVWDLASNQVVTANGENWVRALAFHPGGELLAAGNQRGKVFVFRTADGSLERSFDAHGAALFDIAFTKDGAMLTAGDNSVKLWPVGDAGEPKVLGGFTLPVWAVAASPQGGVIAAAGADKVVRLWDDSGAELAVLSGHTDWVTDLVFTADGQSLISVGHDRTVRVWSIATRSAVEAIGPSPSSLWGVSISADGNRLAAGTRSNGAVLYGRSWRAESSLPLAVTPPTTNSQKTVSK